MKINTKDLNQLLGGINDFIEFIHTTEKSYPVAKLKFSQQYLDLVSSYQSFLTLYLVDEETETMQ